MATGTRLMQEISDQFLNCKICFENFRDPKTLSCLHTFCCDCLQQQYNSEASGRSSRYAIYSRSVTCPLCRQKTDLPTGGVRRLPDNFVVANLREVLAKRSVSKVPPCEICHSVRSKNVDACSKCLDCCKLLCKGCVEQHVSTKVTQKHTLIDLEGEKNIECKVHPDESVRFYCEPCDTCICVVCTFQEHKDHEVCSFTDGFDKHKSDLETLSTRCKERLEVMTKRLESINKHESSVKDVKEKIRDVAISYIAKVRAKERQLLKDLDEQIGSKMIEFLESKPVLQEAVDELQSTCSLTDIMLKDKGVELLLLKKEMESKMNHLLDTSLPEMPDKVNYDITFIPGETALGHLSYGANDIVDGDLESKHQMFTGTDINEKLENGKNAKNQTKSIYPDVISNCTQTDQCRTQEISTSMLANMKIGFSHNDSQTDLTKAALDELYMTARKAAMDSRTETGSGAMSIREIKNEETPPPDLLPKSLYTPHRWIRSRKVQTDISATDFLASRQMSDREYVHALLMSEQLQNKSKQGPINENVIVARDPSFRRTSDAETMTIQATKASEALSHTPHKSSASSVKGHRHMSVHAVWDSSNVDTQTPVVSFNDAFTSTENQAYTEKATCTPSVVLIDRETGTPHVTNECKTTWTELVSTSDRATSTITPQLHNRGTVTVAVKTGDVSFQATPYTQTIATNTPAVNAKDAELQATAEVIDQGTIPDIAIEEAYAKFQNGSNNESSVDSIPAKPSLSAPVQKCDRACDAFKIATVSKATETLKVKTVTSATETVSPKFVDKDASTTAVTYTDQWTETVSPQLVSTGVTPPRPSTLDVGVATVFIQTNDQASCTDVVTHRNAHTETIISVCDNETLTESPGHVDAQTSVQLATENAETETDPTACTDQASNTDPVDSPPIARRQATHTSTSVEADVQTDFSHIYCSVCHHFDKAEAGQSNGDKERVTIGVGDHQTVDQSKGLNEPSNKPLVTNEVGTMAISCATCEHNLHEAGIQTLTPQQIDKASSTTFDFDHEDFLERALSRQYQDAATSTESLPYIGLLSEIDVDELIVVPEAAFELISDSDSDAGRYDVPMVDSETCTDFLQLVEAGTQTILAGLVLDEGQGTEVNRLQDKSGEAATDSGRSQGGKGIGEIIRSLVLSEEDESMFRSDYSKENGSNNIMNIDVSVDEATSKHLVSIGINTDPKVTFEKETCTPISHLFTKGTMTFYVSKMDKSTSTLGPSRMLMDPRLGQRGMVKTKSEDKITMTPKTEKRDVAVETESTVVNGRIEKCISKLRNISERLNSPTGKKAVDGESFFGNSFTSSSPKPKPDPEDLKKCVAADEDQVKCTADAAKVEEERIKNLNNLLQQTSKPAAVRPKDFVAQRKPQPITTLKGRKPVSVKGAEGMAINSGNSLTVNETFDAGSGSKSLPRQFSIDRPRPVRMGSQPLVTSRLPLLRYNSAPGRIATVPSHTLLMKSQNAMQPCVRPTSPRTSPSKIPISKKLSPPDKTPLSPPVERKLADIPSTTRPQMRHPHPLPSITETRTPSSCSDNSMTSYVSSSSAMESSSAAVDTTGNKRHSTETSSTVDKSQITSSSSTSMSTSLTEESKRKPNSRPTSTATSSSLATLNSESFSDSVFKKSSTETINSAASTETLEDKSSTTSTPTKKSGMGLMQRLLSKRKKNSEQKKKKPIIVSTGPSTAEAATALAKAAPVPQAPAPESQAHGAQLQLPPHHYPPQPEPKPSPAPQKSRPFVYVRQRIFNIQQDSVENPDETMGATSTGAETKTKPQTPKSPTKQPQKQQPPPPASHQQPPRASPKPSPAGKEKQIKEKTKDKTGQASKADSASEKEKAKEKKIKSSSKAKK